MSEIPQVRTCIRARVLLVPVVAFVLSSGVGLAQGIVFDQGPTTGTKTGDWANTTGSQNFADKATFSSSTTITAIDIFTAESPTAGTVHIKILADAAGVPGSVLYSEDRAPDAWVADATTGGFKVTALLTTPFVAAAGTTYWYGLSGNGFELGQYGVVAPGDSRMAQFSGATFTSMTVMSVGDQMFQLDGNAGPSASVAAVPALGRTGLIAVAMLLATAGVLGIRRLI